MFDLVWPDLALGLAELGWGAKIGLREKSQEDKCLQERQTETEGLILTRDDNSTHKHEEM